MLLKLVDIKSRDSLIDYFKFKEKYNYKYSQEELESQLEHLALQILSLNNHKKFNNVFVPETENSNLIRLSSLVSDNTIIIKKKAKPEIISLLENQKFQKDEKNALFKSIEEMSSIKMAKIKANQRKRFEDILFDDLSDDILMDNSLLLDDSSFSGFTYKALKKKVPKTTMDVIIFSKNIGEFHE